MKKVLLITPEFFNYYKQMIEEIKSVGFEVDWFRDIPTASKVYKAVSRVDKKLVQPSVSKYLKEILAKIKSESYDKVIFVYGMTFSFSKENIAEIKKSAKNAEFVIYLWDSIKNLKGSEEIIKLFDKVYSFDKSDICEKVKFLPLFYTHFYSDIRELSNNMDYKYFCSYIGTAHPKKIKMINEMSASLSKKYTNQFIYHYMPSKLKFAYHKLLSSEYKRVKYSDLQTEKLSSKEIIGVLKDSFCVLDSPQEGQSGLTIRTIETIGACKKLITSNENIKTYDFYSPTNIYIYKENEEFDFNSDFFTKPYEPIDDNILEKYSIRSWIKTLLD